MRVKKFRCIQCGGPKLNPYTTPYVVCDFCGSLTDIDFTNGMEKWNESLPRTLNYQFQKMSLMSRCQAALSIGDQRSYFALQKEYWDLYYRSFPDYLPPSIDTDQKYAIYIEICALSSTESAFDPKWHDHAASQAKLQAAVTFSEVGGRKLAESVSFFRLADLFISITQEGMRSFYQDARFGRMHEFLPEPVHLKMKTSMFVQAWIPYLTDADAGKLLRKLGFSNEYVEIEPPKGKTIDCVNCNTSIFAPEGSFRVFCEQCRRVTIVRSEFFCLSCGAQNAVPDDVSKPANCSNCGIANRLINPQFGT